MASQRADRDPPRVTRSFPAAPSSVAEARHWAGAFLAGHGHVTRGPALLVLSELVTNAVRYGAGTLRVVVELRERELHLEVFDAGPGRPEPQPLDPDADHGRGLVVVSTVALRWGSRALPDGKAVWADLER